MSTYQHHIGRIEPLVDTIKDFVGLQDWIINVEIKNESHEDKDGTEAEIEDFIEYHEANLTIYPEFFKRDPAHQEKMLFHELTHLLICRLHPYMAPAGDDALEEVVQTIAMRFYLLRHP